MSGYSPDQAEAIRRIDLFLAARNPPRKYFSLQGLAGTGKSKVLADLARRYDALLLAPTGKAASVLSRRTGLTATTIHSGIYAFRGEFVDEETGERSLSFKSRITDGAWSRKIAFVDESSMVAPDLAMDLLATGCKVVAAGDPGQLQPVRGTRFFDHADATLTTIHRQALESAIVRQAHSVRHNGTYQADGPDFRVQRFVEREDILAADIFLCWRNNTRHMLNALVRAHRGLEGYPVAGEPVMCLRNDHDVGILNGAVYRLLRDYDHRRKVARIKNERDEIIDVERCRIEQMDPPGHVDDTSEEHPFAFAGAATVHKFQGSETDTGILVDEYDRQDQRREFLYTGFTRFAKKIIVQRNF